MPFHIIFLRSKHSSLTIMIKQQQQMETTNVRKFSLVSNFAYLCKKMKINALQLDFSAKTEVFECSL